MENQKPGIRIPLWMVILFILAALIVGALIYSIFYKPGDVKTAEKEKAVIEKKIDSTQTVRTSDRNDLVKNSQNRSAEAKQIKQSTTDETPVIADTTYTAMCKHITEFKPD